MDPQTLLQDDHGHGTHISGIIAASHNQVGISGIYYSGTILPLKIFNSAGFARQLHAALAIRYAADRADIINCSWGYSRKTTVLEDAIRYARKRLLLWLLWKFWKTNGYLSSCI